MRGKVKQPGVIEAISGRTYDFASREVIGSRLLQVGDDVEFNPQGGTAADIKLVERAAVSGGHGGSRPRDEMNPYDFISVAPDLAVSDAPMYHDGSQRGGGGETITGEIRLTIRVLTPLMPGNYRYTAAKAAGIESDGTLPADRFGLEFPVEKEKPVLEPLRDAAGRVLVAGSALTGMLRQDLAALLSAPMERVAERSYSYRPNMGHASDPGKAQYEARAAVVESVSGATPELRVLPGARAAVFLHGNRGTPPDRMHTMLGSPKPAGTVIESVQGLKIDNQTRRLVPASNATVTLNHHYVSYKGGIDGTGTLAGKFASGSRVYKHALVSIPDWDEGTVVAVPEPVWQHYRRTQSHLADRYTGHISSRHPLFNSKQDQDVAAKVGQEINDNRALEVGQLVYVEIDKTRSGAPSIVSMGRHFHYRWAYTDTVRRRWNPKSGRLEARSEVSPAPFERSPRPLALTGGRLLFGYAASDDVDSGTDGIGKDDYTRLAGRLGFNIALEQTTNPADDSRFLHGGRAIPLTVLGEPRPSAVEHYLDQRQRRGSVLVTYGDLPGEAGGELRGRKFYPHQAEVVNEGVHPRYEPSKASFDLRSELARLKDDVGLRGYFVDSLKKALYKDFSTFKPNESWLGLGVRILNVSDCDRKLKRWKEKVRSVERETGGRGGGLKLAKNPVINRFLDTIGHLRGQQSTLARFVLKPDSELKCTLRFRALRPWELGAVLLALEPARIRELPDLPRDVVGWLNERQLDDDRGHDAPPFAHKLGYGRPLGLGSVQLQVDRVDRWNGDSLETLFDRASTTDSGKSNLAGCLQALRDKLAPILNDGRGREVFKSWLEMHRFRGTPVRRYPAGQYGSTCQWHTNLRRWHAAMRRTRSEHLEE